MSNLSGKHTITKKERNPTVFLVAILVGITLLYQLRPLLDDSQFIWISIPTYAIVLGILILFSSLLTIKLYKQHHFQSKAFLLFTIGAAFWFIGDQIWVLYDYVYEIDPFPSIADIFYISSYPLFFVFLLISLKPIKKLISKKIWLFAFLLAFSFLIPSLIGYSNSLNSDDVELTVFSKSILL